MYATVLNASLVNLIYCPFKAKPGEMAPDYPDENPFLCLDCIFGSVNPKDVCLLHVLQWSCMYVTQLCSSQHNCIYLKLFLLSCQLSHLLRNHRNQYSVTNTSIGGTEPTHKYMYNVQCNEVPDLMTHINSQISHCSKNIYLRLLQIHVKWVIPVSIPKVYRWLALPLP